VYHRIIESVLSMPLSNSDTKIDTNSLVVQVKNNTYAPPTMHIQLVCHHTTKHAIKSATTLVRKASLFDEPPKSAEQEMEGHNKGVHIKDNHQGL